MYQKWHKQTLSRYSALERQQTAAIHPSVIHYEILQIKLCHAKLLKCFKIRLKLEFQSHEYDFHIVSALQCLPLLNACLTHVYGKLILHSSKTVKYGSLQGPFIYSAALLSALMALCCARKILVL